jgi:hypothetical protein
MRNASEKRMGEAIGKPVFVAGARCRAQSDLDTQTGHGQFDEVAA